MKSLSAGIVFAHLCATWFMVGLIWTIHTVHYPLFVDVGSATYTTFQLHHVERIGRLLLVPWGVEGLTALIILISVWRSKDRGLYVPVLVGSIAMGVVLIVSGFFSAPAHADLADGFDAAVHARLMKADLVRTIAWTIRGVTALWIAAVLWRRTSSANR